MGVPGFFAWLIKQYNQGVIIQNTPNNNEKIDILYIDANCLFHPQCFKIIETMPDETDVSKLENKMMKRIINYIEYLIKYVNPQKLVYIAVDGPAPLAKVTQQRRRRFRTIDDNKMRTAIKRKHGKKTNNVWNNTVITPGTEFMEELHQALDIEFKKKTNIKIIYSSYHTVGEGEHKILQHIKKTNPKSPIAIYGLDADLFFLAMASNMKNIYLVREISQIAGSDKRKIEDVEKDVNEDLKYVSINTVRECYNEQIIFIIQSKIEQSPPNAKVDIDTNYCNDFIFLCYLLGNDFLPHLPSIDIKKSGLDIVLDNYTDIYISSNKNLIYINEKKLKINMEFLTELLKRLGEQEYEYFTEILPEINNKTKRHKCNATDKYEIEMWELENMRKIKIEDPIKLGYGNEELWKFRYYEHYFNTTEYQHYTIQDVCNNYIYGLKWVSEYYFNDCPDWKWQYVYTHAPFISDLYKYIKNNNIDINVIKFNKNKPLNPCCQLMAVLPPQCKELIPKSYQYLVNSHASPIIDMFPKKVEIDMIGKDQYWQCIPLVPILDVERVVNEVSKLKLTKKEAIRDMVCDDIYY